MPDTHYQMPVFLSRLLIAASAFCIIQQLYRWYVHGARLVFFMQA